MGNANSDVTSLTYYVLHVAMTCARNFIDVNTFALQKNTAVALSVMNGFSAIWTIAFSGTYIFFDIDK